MDKLKLEPTAALVMQWSLELYQATHPRRYLERLDLTSGNRLYDQCRQICPWYREIILNRKFWIRRLIEARLDSGPESLQVVLLAAGKSPLAIELLTRSSRAPLTVIEVDVAGMYAKQQLGYDLFPQLRPRWHFVEEDITAPDLVARLQELAGFKPDLPALVVLEGISYYLEPAALERISAAFGNQPENRLIIEYLVPDERVTPSRRAIPAGVFGLIRDECGLPDITVYTRETLDRLLAVHGGRVLDSYSMRDMEKARTGQNRYFPNEGDGWIECLVGLPGPVA